MNKRFRPTILALALALLNGCGGYPAVKKAVDDSVLEAERQAAVIRDKSAIANRNRENYVERSSKPFISAVSVARPTSETFPTAMKRVTLNAPGGYNIQQAAQLITEATGIPVTLSPDVFRQPAGLQNPAMAMAGAGGQAGQAQLVAAQIQQQFPITLNYRETDLDSILDSVCAAANGLSHEYKDGRIGIYRYQTRTFSLAVPLGQFSTTMTIGKTTTVSTGATAATTGAASSGASNSGSTGAANAAFSTSYTAEQRVIAELKEGLSSVISADGHVVVMGSAGTVTVTDGRRQVEEVGRIVADLNKTLSRQAIIKLELLSYRTGEDAEAGLDWNVVLSKLNAAGNNTLFTISSAAGSTSTTAGSIGVKLLKQVNGQTEWTDTGALIKALNSVGKARLVRTWEGFAMNRRVTPVAAIRNTSYIQATTPATATVGGTGGVPGLTPGSISYGFVLNLIPTITDRNSMILEFGIDLSDLNALPTQTSGTGANQQSIELPDTVAQQLLQGAAVGTGEVLVVSGLDQSTHRYDKRTLTRDGEPGLGGLFQGTAERESLIVLITPVIGNAGF